MQPFSLDLRLESGLENLCEKKHKKRAGLIDS